MNMMKQTELILYSRLWSLMLDVGNPVYYKLGQGFVINFVKGEYA